jgi:hypothetical protein
MTLRPRQHDGYPQPERILAASRVYGSASWNERRRILAETTPLSCASWNVDRRLRSGCVLPRSFRRGASQLRRVRRQQDYVTPIDVPMEGSQVGRRRVALANRPRAGSAVMPCYAPALPAPNHRPSGVWTHEEMSRSWKPVWPSVCTVTYAGELRGRGDLDDPGMCRRRGTPPGQRRLLRRAERLEPMVSIGRGRGIGHSFRLRMRRRGGPSARGARWAPRPRGSRGGPSTIQRATSSRREAVGACLNPSQASLPARDSPQRRP